MSKNTSITICVDQDLKIQFKNLAIEQNITEKQLFENLLKSNPIDENLELQITDLKNQICDLEKLNVENNLKIEHYKKYLITPKLGAVLLALIDNKGELYKNINTIEEGIDALLKPYWRRNCFIASKEEIQNFVNVIENESQS